MPGEELVLAAGASVPAVFVGAAGAAGAAVTSAGTAHVLRGLSNWLREDAPPGAQARPTKPIWTAAQITMVRLISQKVWAAPLPPALAASRPALVVAMVVNAWHESRLDPAAHNGAGSDDSWGLFQVNRRGELGRKWAPVDLIDPVRNIAIILSEVWARKDALEATLHHGGTVEDLTGAFTLHVERPARAIDVARERGHTVRIWMGSQVADAPALRWVG